MPALEQRIYGLQWINGLPANQVFLPFFGYENFTIPEVVENVREMGREFFQKPQADILRDIYGEVFLAGARDPSTRTPVIAGMTMLHLIPSFGFTIGYVMDVYVRPAYRGYGLGRALMEALIESGNLRNLRNLELTSGPSERRVVARGLYEKLGFVQVATAHGERGTNLYRYYYR